MRDPSTPGDKERGGDSPTPTSKIIAVGGAKGGIGKTLLTTNLGIFLSSQGKRTILVDLDLGAGNLHLLLGIWNLKHKIQDFLDKEIPTIEDVMIPSKYGPYLVGAGTASLGSANIHFAKKLKLLKTIKKLNADYIILDLGGDTSYNIIDYYLLSDFGIVVTTCDPASYLDAYGFIKMALYRKLSRLFGTESEFRMQKDLDLVQLINDFITPESRDRAGYVSDLLDTIREDAPRSLPLVEKVIGEFKSNLVVNMVGKDSEAIALIERIRKVTKKMLSIDVDLLGSIPYHANIKSSAKELVPEIVKYPDGVFAACLPGIVNKIEQSVAKTMSPL